MSRVTFDFTGTRVLVTGGTSGIGHAIARAFAGAGASVLVTGRKAASSDYDVDLGGLDYARLDVQDNQGRTPLRWAQGEFLATHPPEAKPSTIALIKKLTGESPAAGSTQP